MAAQEWIGRERREFCTAHTLMVEHDERVAAELRLYKWLAGAMFLVALGSIGAVISIGYYSGAITQTVKNNTEQLKILSSKIDRHIERTIK